MIVVRDAFRGTITTIYLFCIKKGFHVMETFFVCGFSMARDASRAYAHVYNYYNSALDVGNARSTFLNNPCNTLPGPTSITSAQPSAII